MKLYIALEIVRDNEGNPGIWLFKSRGSRDRHARKLRLENDEGGERNADVLIVRRSITVSK